MSGEDVSLAGLPLVPLESRIVAILAPMTFLENLDVSPDGTIIMTSLLDGRLWSVPYGGKLELIAQIDGRAVSVASAPDGGWLVFGATLDGLMSVYAVRPDGSFERIVDVPAGAFPNGVQRFPDNHYLWADSRTATIWDIDYVRRTASSWLSHPLLAPVEGRWEPALNGMKVFGEKLYMTNSSQATVLALDIKDGRPAGEPFIVAHDLAADDFAFDVNGSIYLTTHPQDTVVRLDPDGTRTRVAGPDQGVRGCTACRFGRRSGDETGLYVVTDGGLFNPASGGLQPSRVVRLETGVAGATVDFV